LPGAIFVQGGEENDTFDEAEGNARHKRRIEPARVQVRFRSLGRFSD